MAASRENFGLVQALRGIAALWVVLFHVSEGGHIGHLRTVLPAFARSVFDLGNNGVAIFFALSGFVIAHSIYGDRITAGYVGRFALRRSIRLDPAYWASIAFFVAFAVVSSVAKHEEIALPSAAQVAANLTYTQLFLGYPSINTVYWTLCYEVQFYLVLILCVMAAQRLGPAVFLACFLTALVFGTGSMSTSLPGLFVDRWHCFFLGVLAYWAKENRVSLAAFLLLGAALLLSHPSAFTVISTATAAGLMLARRTGFIANGLATRPMLFLGTVSYSLYLTHNPVTGASFFVLAKIGIPEGIGVMVTVAACLAVAAAFWWAIERPTMQLAHRVKLPRKRRDRDGVDRKTTSSESAAAYGL